MHGQSLLSFSFWQVLSRAVTPQNLGCVGWENRLFSFRVDCGLGEQVSPPDEQGGLWEELTWH